MPDIICRSCKGQFHETTDAFDPDKRAHGAMFRLKDKYIPMRWGSFPEVETTQSGHLECPNCGTLYTDGAGRVACDIAVERVSHRASSTAIPEDKNSIILQMAEAGATATEIGKVVGATQQAVTKRIRALQQLELLS